MCMRANVCELRNYLLDLSGYRGEADNVMKRQLKGGSNLSCGVLRVRDSLVGMESAAWLN